MKIVIEIPEAQVAAAKSDLMMYLGPLGLQKITDRQLQTIFKSNPWLLGGLSDGGFDTLEREYALHEFSKQILEINEEWPMNGSSESERNSFYARVAKKVERLNDESK